ncbi:MAG: alpha/beta hydrolase [Methylococcaceae bacterium]|nr:alpha/beta hydrolase [Methylococcaceae bacterium]
MSKLVLFNHGKDSEPWGEKVLALAEIAKQQGYEVDSLDYRSTNDPTKRVEMILAYDFSAYDEVILVGSSMGSYVATVASETIKPKGIFLMAPAFYLEGYPQTEFNPPSKNTFVIHGWQDDVVPPANVWRFSQQHHCRLRMLEGDHRLTAVLNEVCEEFKHFIIRLGN